MPREKPLYVAAAFLGLGGVIVGAAVVAVLLLSPVGELEGIAPVRSARAPSGQPGKMSSPKLALPSEKPCLAGPTDVGEGGDEGEFVGSAGLDSEVVGSTMVGSTIP